MMPATNIFASKATIETYRQLRYLAAISLITMPLLVALSGRVLGHDLEPSLSAYYHVHENGDLPRTLFVIFLAFLGGVLLAYRGLSTKDNWLHNAAGISSLAVAIFPMQCDPCVHEFCKGGIFEKFYKIHGLSAGFLFLSAVVGVWYAGGKPLQQALDLLENPASWKKRLKKIQWISLAPMVLGMAVSSIYIINPTFWAEYSPTFRLVFWVEYLGFLGFGVYWWRLMKFIDAANEKGFSQVKQTKATPSPDVERGQNLDFRADVVAEPQWQVIP